MTLIKHADESAKAIRPDVIVKVAQLLSIMDSAVYLRYFVPS
jgi:hypothetical protein